MNFGEIYAKCHLAYFDEFISCQPSMQQPREFVGELRLAW
jgi:hypothetical protein